MATFICTQCGSRIETEGQTKIAHCPVCEALFILPNQLDKKENIYLLAGEALAAKNFDVAETYYSRILKVDAMETAAHWGYLLSKFGVEISREPETFGNVIFHRLEHSSFTADPSYEKMIAYCPGEARYYYEGLSRRIETQHKKMLEISRTIENYDIYIDCTDASRTADYLLASQAGKALDEAGYRVFLPCTMLNNVRQEDYNLYEMAAAEKSEAMLVVMSPETDRGSARYQAVWKRFLAWRWKDASRKMLSLYQQMRPEDLPLELQALQSLDCGGGDFTHTLLREINRMFGRQGQKSSDTRQILEALRQGQKFLEEKDWKKAESQFSRVLQLDPEESRAHWGLICSKTENLTKPVLSDEVDKDYELALKFSSRGQKENYQKTMTALMKEAVWNELLSATGNFTRTEDGNGNRVKNAIRQVYRYLPPDDGRLQQIEAYQNRIQVREEIRKQDEAYQKRDTAVQPLFAEQVKGEAACDTIRSNVIDLFGRYKGLLFTNGIALWLVAASLVLLVYQGRQNVAYKGEAFYFPTIIYWIGCFFLAKGFNKTLSTLTGIDFQRSRFLIGAEVVSVVFIYPFFRLAAALVTLLFALALHFLQTVLMMTGAGSARKTRKRLIKAEQELKETDERLKNAYQEQIREIYRRHGETPEEKLPEYKVSHSETFRWKKMPHIPSPALYAPKTAVFLVLTVAAVTFASNYLYTRGWHDIVDMAPSIYFTLGLRSDGTVTSAGYNGDGQCNVKKWKDIVQIVSGMDFSAGLRADGGVCVAASHGKVISLFSGEKESPVLKAESWTDIVQLDASEDLLVGLKKDGTVVAVSDAGRSYDLSVFSDIVKVYAATDFLETEDDLIFGVNGSGEVILCGPDGEDGYDGVKQYLLENTGSGEGRRPVTEIAGEYIVTMLHFADGSWKGIGSDYFGTITASNSVDFTGVTDVFCGTDMVGMKPDGTVVFAGNNPLIEEGTGSWQNVTAIKGWFDHVLALHADGTVSAAGNNGCSQCDTQDWSSVKAVYASKYSSYGLKEDGTVEAAGLSTAGNTYVRPKNPLELFQFWLEGLYW